MVAFFKVILLVIIAKYSHMHFQQVKWFLP